ncbi:trimeric LpxA-like protein [Massarina eburnea CBS 473.64]|uniref:Trimeric LpxA-like protein n=1 Tax=Massarina eburnea CBS 473.64 TaxID=1395130 RepID=A0A6A6S5T9_9PLEO|nr:trimeric LpxA-like protein [Massarina eburnea CBS 473.64]
MESTLTSARWKARTFAHKYNHYFPAPETNPTFDTVQAERQGMLEGILGHVGPSCFIEPPFSIDYGCNISLGASFYSNFNLTILDCSLVTIGDRCMFGPNVSIFAATHETEVQSRRDFIEYGLPVSIGDDCWVGGTVVILPGVTIGKGCTIAAGSVVTKDVPDWSVAMGSKLHPASRVIYVGKGFARFCAGNCMVADFSCSSLGPAKVVKKVTAVPDLKEKGGSADVEIGEERK